MGLAGYRAAVGSRSKRAVSASDDSDVPVHWVDEYASAGMDELSACLSCGADLEIGVIVGQQRFLNWEPQGTKGGATMHGKEHLAKGSLGSGPRLHAARCRGCGLGYFHSAQAV